MTNKDRVAFANFMMAVSSYYSEELSTPQVALYFDALSDYEIRDVENAFRAYAKDKKNRRKMPLAGDLTEYLDAATGRPGADEAWALIPKSEEASGMVTREMLAAWDTVRTLYEEDRTAARMGFRDAYERFVKLARAEGQKVEWIASMGSDPSLRAIALDRGVAAGRITREVANTKLMLPAKEEHIAIAADKAFDDPNISPEMKAKIRAFLLKIADRAKKYDANKG